MMGASWTEVKLDEFKYRRWLYKVYIAFPKGCPHLKVVEIDPGAKSPDRVLVG